MVRLIITCLNLTMIVILNSVTRNKTPVIYQFEGKQSDGVLSKTDNIDMSCVIAYLIRGVMKNMNILYSFTDFFGFGNIFYSSQQ